MLEQRLRHIVVGGSAHLMGRLVIRISSDLFEIGGKRYSGAHAAVDALGGRPKRPLDVKNLVDGMKFVVTDARTGHRSEVDARRVHHTSNFAHVTGTDDGKPVEDELFEHGVVVDLVRAPSDKP